MAATNVHFSFKDAQGRPKAGTLHVAPVRRHISGSTVVVLGGFDVALDSDGTATVQLEPTDNTFAWMVREFPDDTDCAFERVVQVPASTSTVEYTSLVDVDKDTLAPTLNSGATVTYLLASSLSEAQAMSAANPGQMVFYPESETAAQATMLLSDILDARAVAADNADASSAAASQARSDASVAASRVVSATADAQNVADVKAQAVADADTVSDTVTVISAKQTEVESKAADAVEAIDATVKQVQAKADDAAGSVGKTEDIASGGDAGVGSGSSEE